MPYLGRTLEKLIDPKSIYRHKLVKILTPEFYVFYNGNEPFPLEKIMRLSDAHLEKPKHLTIPRAYGEQEEQ